MTIAKGFCESEADPVQSAAGRSPRQATKAVIMMGRSRTREASKVALADFIPLQAQFVDVGHVDDRRLNRDAHQHQQARERKIR